MYVYFPISNYFTNFLDKWLPTMAHCQNWEAKRVLIFQSHKWRHRKFQLAEEVAHEPGLYQLPIALFTFFIFYFCSATLISLSTIFVLWLPCSNSRFLINCYKKKLKLSFTLFLPLQLRRHAGIIPLRQMLNLCFRSSCLLSLGSWRHCSYVSVFSRYNLMWFLADAFRGFQAVGFWHQGLWGSQADIS